MTLFRLPRLAVAAAALLATGGIASAASPNSRIVEVPPGAVVLVLPAEAVPMMAPPGFGFDDAMPSPAALLTQVDQMMQQMFDTPSQDRLLEAALRQMQAGAPMAGVSGMSITTVSNGNQSCTRQVIYGGNGAAPRIDVRMTGNACGSSGMPAALPDQTAPVPAAQPIPHTLRVERHVPQTYQVAELTR